jgi:hypothetical protein
VAGSSIVPRPLAANSPAVRGGNRSVAFGARQLAEPHGTATDPGCRDVRRGRRTYGPGYGNRPPRRIAATSGEGAGRTTRWRPSSLRPHGPPSSCQRTLAEPRTVPVA